MGCAEHCWACETGDIGVWHANKGRLNMRLWDASKHRHAAGQVSPHGSPAIKLVIVTQWGAGVCIHGVAMMQHTRVTAESCRVVLLSSQ